MKLYRFSPIKNKEELLRAIEHIHFSCYELCKASFGKYLPNAGNIGVFCHYDDEYDMLTTLREQMTEPSDAFNQKYFRLHRPIIIPAKGGVPETVYTHLYIRKPDPYRHHVGDIDFYLPEAEYAELRDAIKEGRKTLPGGRIYNSQTVDMIELYNPDIDVLAYVSTWRMADIIKKTYSQ